MPGRCPGKVFVTDSMTRTSALLPGCPEGANFLLDLQVRVGRLPYRVPRARNRDLSESQQKERPLKPRTVKLECVVFGWDSWAINGALNQVPVLTAHYSVNRTSIHDACQSILNRGVDRGAVLCRTCSALCEHDNPTIEFTVCLDLKAQPL